MTNHYIINGFKKYKRNKRLHTIFLTTTLSVNDIETYLQKGKFVYHTITDVDSFTDEPRTWLKPEMEEINLGLFETLRILNVIGSK